MSVFGIHGLCLRSARSLDTLFLQSLKHVSALPDLGVMPRLRRDHLKAMTRLTDLTPLRVPRPCRN